MKTPPTPFIVGYITSFSNEVNMLKSIIRFARQASAGWMIVYLQDGDSADDDDVQQDVRNLAEKYRSLGGEFAVLNMDDGPDAAKLQLFEIAVRSHSVTYVLVDNTLMHMPFKDHLQQQLDQALEPAAQRVNVENKAVFLQKPPRRFIRPLHRMRQFFLHVCADVVVGLLYGLFAVLITYSVNYMLTHHVGPVDDSYTYMIFVLFANLCALQAGIWGGVMCTLITSLAANYFFIEPYYMFKLSNLSDVVNWLTLVITSSVTSIISALMIMQFRKSRIEEKNLSLLLDINMTPLRHKNITTLLQDLKKRLKEHVQTDIVFFVPTLINDNKLEVFADPHDDKTLPDSAIVEQIWLEMKQGYVYSHQNDADPVWAYLPLATLVSDVGVLAVKRPTDIYDQTQPTIGYKKLSDMIALILEYINLDQEMYARDIVKEKDKLRTHILSSVSHDLRTPLASIIGSLGLYLSSSLKLKEAQIKALIDNAYVEANRLDGFITNILTMTKLEAGLIKFRKEQIRPQQLMSGIMDKISWKLPADRIVVQHSDFRDSVTVDVTATELVIGNLLDNALRHAPPETPITLGFADADAQHFSLTVANQGTSIPDTELETIFDKYARLQREDSQQAATGLGLALCRGLMQGQGGTIVARATPGGTSFIVTWPNG